MEWVNVWQFSTHTNYFKSTYSSNRFHWTDNLHQRRLICKPHGDWGWPTTLSSGPTHEGWLPIVLRKENDRNKIAYAKTFQAEIDVTTAAPLYHPLTYGWRAWNLSKQDFESRKNFTIETSINKNSIEIRQLFSLEMALNIHYKVLSIPKTI